jgi:hypothetical protein
VSIIAALLLRYECYLMVSLEVASSNHKGKISYKTKEKIEE